MNINNEHIIMDVEKQPKLTAKFGTRHAQILLTSLTLLIVYGMRVSISVAVVAMTDVNSNSPHKKYDWTVSETSMILSSFLWGYAISLFPSGYLSNVWSAKKLFGICVFLSAVVNLTTPFLAEYGGWIAVCGTRVAIGLIQGGVLPCMHVLVSRWAPPHERSRMSTYTSSCSALGTVLAMALSGIIADSSLGWPSIFYIFGISSIIASIIFYFNVYDSPTLHPTISEDEKSYIVNSSCHDKPNALHTPWKQILTSVPMWAIIITHTGSNWGGWTLLTEIPTYMKTILKFGVADSGLVTSLAYLSWWFCSIPLSYLADFAIRRNVSVTVIRKIFNTFGLWVPAMFLVILCFVDTAGKWWPVAMLILALGTHSAIHSGFNVNHIDLSPNFSGTMYGISNAISSTICIMAPLACGAIVQDSMDPARWHLVFYLTVFIFFFANLVYIIFASGETQEWNNNNGKNNKNSKTASVVSFQDPRRLSLDP